MVDYGYMCVIHEHTAVFSITDPTARHLVFCFAVVDVVLFLFLFFYRRQAASASDEPVVEMRIVSLRCYSELFVPPFFSEN